MGAIKLTATLRDVLRKRGFAMDGNFTETAGALSDLRIETPASYSALLGLDHRLHIGAFSHLNGGFIQNTTIGRYCSFARNVQIGHGSHPTNWLSVSPLQYNPDYRDWLQQAGLKSMPSTTPFQWAKHTIIGSDVWLGNGVFIQDGIRIGHGAIVGASSVVTRDVPPYAIVAGNPARLIRMRFPPLIIARLLKAEWWRYAISDFYPLDFSDIDEALENIEARIASGSLQVFQPPIIEIDALKHCYSNPS